MIIDIPTSDDFRNSGIGFLNLAWEKLLKLHRDLKNAEAYFESDEAEYDEYIYEDPEDPENHEIVGINTFRHKVDKELYWSQAQLHLGLSLSLIQQGAEFLLKSKIVGASPFLLLFGVRNQIPRNTQKEDISFSEFKTVNAQDLIKIYNTVVDQHLPENFNSRFERLRNKRNSVTHTVNPSLSIDIEELFIELLEICHVLLGEYSWIELRRNYINSTPQTVLHEPYEYIKHEHEIIELSYEINTIIDFLKPAQVKKYFSFNKRSYRYICPQCFDDTLGWHHNKYGWVIPKLAQLSPNKPDSTTVHCLICRQDSQVHRKKCESKSCVGNVIGYDYDEYAGICLTCAGEEE